MRIVSWNCHYGFDERKVAEIGRYDADILVIQECQKKDFDVAQANWQYGNWYWDALNTENSNLGVAVFSHEYKIEFTPQFDRRWRYVVPYQITTPDDKSFILFAVWTKAGYKSYHEPIYGALKTYSPSENPPAIVIGDFNTGRTAEHEERYTDLKEKLSAKNFEDCSKDKDSTFFQYFDKKRAFQNDYCFVSVGAFTKVDLEIGAPADWIKPELSDHCPIIVDFDW